MNATTDEKPTAGVGERIRRARLAAGYAEPEDAAAKLGMHPKTYPHYEAGRRMPRYDMILRFIGIGMDPKILLGMDDEESGDVTPE